MRDIRFRAWDKKEKKMYYAPKDSPSVIIGSNFWTFNKNNPENQEHLANELTGILIANELTGILMQFTGLKDKNGKEVYEGDIISHETFKPEQRKIIKWQINKGGFNCWSEKWQDWVSRDWINISTNREVIGNIYEGVLPNQKRN